MTLRQSLGRDVERVYALVDELLDREDGVIVIMDGERAVTYARGFAMSPCQLELLTDDLERAVRAVTRAHLPRHRSRRHEAQRGVDAGAGQRSGEARRGDGPGGNQGSGAPRVLRMANQRTASDPG